MDRNRRGFESSIEGGPIPTESREENAMENTSSSGGHGKEREWEEEKREKEVKGGVRKVEVRSEEESGAVDVCWKMGNYSRAARWLLPPGWSSVPELEKW